MIEITESRGLPGRLTEKAMRTTFASAVTAALVLAAALPAHADEAVVGNFDVKFEEMASNCTPPPVALGRGTVRIDVRKTSLTVNIETIPEMAGVVQKSGKINAKTIKVVGTTVVGLSGRYSVAGRVEGGVLSVVLVAEYIRQDTNKPYCTQSWNVSGLRSTSTDDDKDKPAKKKPGSGSDSKPPAH
jgi:hypothetical protein